MLRWALVEDDEVLGSRQLDMGNTELKLDEESPYDAASHHREDRPEIPGRVT